MALEDNTFVENFVKVYKSRTKTTLETINQTRELQVETQKSILSKQIHKNYTQMMEMKIETLQTLKSSSLTPTEQKRLLQTIGAGDLADILDSEVTPVSSDQVVL